MSFDQLKRDIKGGLTYPVYLLHGEESYLIDEAADFLERHLLQELSLIHISEPTRPY